MWLKYFVVFSLFQLIQPFTDVLISWFPMYFIAKLALVIWFMSPKWKGSTHIFDTYIHPKLIEHEALIDQSIDEAQKRIQRKTQHVARASVDLVQEHGRTLLQNVINAAATTPREGAAGARRSPLSTLPEDSNISPTSMSSSSSAASNGDQEPPPPSYMDFARSKLSASVSNMFATTTTTTTTTPGPIPPPLADDNDPSMGFEMEELPPPPSGKTAVVDDGGPALRQRRSTRTIST